MDLTDQVHKKVIGFTFIIFSAFGLLGLFFYEMFIEFIIDMAQRSDDFIPEGMWIFNLIDSLLWAIAILFLIPRLILGIGLVNQKKWANIPSLIYGIISLLNFPLGTILGVYCILVFTAKPKVQET